MSFRAELDDQLVANAQLQAEVFALQGELDEALTLIELQKADLDRYRKAVESTRPNCPERVPEEQLQLAMERVLAAHGDEQTRDGDTESKDDDVEEAARSNEPRRSVVTTTDVAVSTRRVCPPSGSCSIRTKCVPWAARVLASSARRSPNGLRFSALATFDCKSRVASGPASTTR